MSQLCTLRGIGLANIEEIGFEFLGSVCPDRCSTLREKLAPLLDLVAVLAGLGIRADLLTVSMRAWLVSSRAALRSARNLATSGSTVLVSMPAVAEIEVGDVVEALAPLRVRVRV